MNVKIKIPKLDTTEKEVLINFSTSEQKREELKRFCKSNGINFRILFNNLIDQILEAK